MQRVNEFLRSEASTVLLLALALLAQTPHTASVFHRLAPDATGLAVQLSWLHASAYAVALEFATLIFVVRAQRALAWTFALVSVGVNVAYYWRADMQLHEMLAAALVSVALPSAIAFYSHDVARRATHENPQRASARKRTAKRARTQADARTKPQVQAQPDATAQRRAAVQRALAAGALDRAQLAQEFGVHPATISRDVAAVRRNGHAKAS